ncbi:MAG: TadE/TadG family type IV pilus assembly protein [Pseudomonadota bacterium]
MQNYLILLGARLKQLREDISGLALIEFAYTLPLLLGFGLVGIEFTNVILAHQKTERIASTVADQIASNQLPPNEAQVSDLFNAIDQIASPFSFSNDGGGVVVTAVVGVNDTSANKMKNKVAWQRCSNGDAYKSAYGKEWTGSGDIADGPDVSLPNNIVLGQNQMVILTEVYFPYTEIVSEDLVKGLLPNAGTFEQTAMYRTRGQALLDVTPVEGVAKNKCTA